MQYEEAKDTVDDTALQQEVRVCHSKGCKQKHHPLQCCCRSLKLLSISNRYASARFARSRFCQQKCILVISVTESVTPLA